MVRAGDSSLLPGVSIFFSFCPSVSPIYLINRIYHLFNLIYLICSSIICLLCQHTLSALFMHHHRLPPVHYLVYTPSLCTRLIRVTRLQAPDRSVHAVSSLGLSLRGRPAGGARSAGSASEVRTAPRSLGRGSPAPGGSLQWAC